MNLRMKLLHAIAVLSMPAAGLSQWVHYPMADVPRKADGNANLTAPAPRLACRGHPFPRTILQTATEHAHHAEGEVR